MGIRKIGSLVALSASILLMGGMNAGAESGYFSVKERVAETKERAQVGKVEGFESIKSGQLKNSVLNKGLLQTPKKESGYTTKEAGDILYEYEPNDSPYEADFLPRFEFMLGTFTEEDIDVYQIEVEEEGPIVISGAMPVESLSDIGFFLGDEYDNYIEPDYVQLDDHQMTTGYYLPTGIYYIFAINMGEYVTDDVYAIAWDMLEEEEDTTAPSVPVVDRFDDQDSVLTGDAEPHSSIEVELDGMLLGEDTADFNGRFEVSLPESYPVGTILSVTATDMAGNRSEVSYVTVADSTFTGWITENGKRYHYTKGVRDKGWYSENGKYYFLDTATGEIKTGWVFIDNKWFFFDRMTGVKKTGWVQVGTKRYYMDSYGVMQTGWEKVGTTWYYLNADGTMATGWVKSGTSWYYLASTGAMKTGWVKDKGAWYYLASSGAMKTGWLKDGGSWYYLASSGVMKTGWVKDGGSWYYLAGSGVMKTGWVKVGTKYYYLYSSGKMAYNTKIGNYRLGKDGAWIR